MKLMFCDFCFDVFKLDYDLRSCKCGQVKGKYEEDGHHAVTNGEGRCLAIGNGSLIAALNGAEQQFKYEDYDTFLAWVRPHTGPENPRSRVETDL